ncbi:MAG TPA: hypothetical protein VF292_10015 [Rhodanobacteraceae bacterium]
MPAVNDKRVVTRRVLRYVRQHFSGRAAGSTCAALFSRLARRSLMLRSAHSRRHRIVTRFAEGFDDFVASIIAPVASGWSGGRV